ncbi:MAG: hypothetical protein P8L44_19805 [Opitutales bacterium]|jgi:hypothetical protein|nr:hypothetical protein [Opitutales bacterium]MDG2170161.1 hypothetical protein [Opitutales bacterium]
MQKLALFISFILLSNFASAKSTYQLSTPGKLLLSEDFGSSELPELFTVGVGDWAIIDGTLRGRQQPEDKHTAFRKIYLDHYHVIYEYDMKLEGDGFTRLMINWDLVHVSKGEIHLDKAQVFKIKEKGKRAQMAAQNRDQGLDPLQGNYEEKTHAVNEVSLNLREGQWYHVILESVGDKMCLQVDGQTVIAQHVGFTEKKDNFGFQAGGFDTHLYIDNVRVREAIPKR